MNGEYTIKSRKLPDGKRLVMGNVKPGKFGPQIGMKVTPELTDMVNSAAPGSWLNFDLYPKDQPGQSDHRQGQSKSPDDSVVPF